ncbi:hypothetical protein [Calothrix sp. NIES-2098]|uniref:hypothetical protein n=1 Tax=Calothrix sp. NIES-2098 TaxID=1954171 RepID=UPI000B609555|nr:hypothetical protein NIES2098_35760 [Calothrix sp. NIES-2098]
MNPLLEKISQLNPFSKIIFGAKSKKEQISNSVITDASSISGLGWRQGCVLPIEMVRNLGKIFEKEFDIYPNDSDLIFSVSHDCDITNSSFEAEPKVELMLARAISGENKDDSLFWGRNPRKFQFINSSNQLYEISIHDRTRIDRKHLLDIYPDQERMLPGDVIKQICLWLSKRYFRAAFPDEFNLRIKKIQNSIRDKIKKKSQNITAVYIQVSDNELPSDQKYQIIITATMHSTTYENTDLREEAQKTIDYLASRLDSCAGIEVLDSLVVSEAGISIDDLRILKRWDYDYLSFGADTPDEISPFL